MAYNRPLPKKLPVLRITAEYRNEKRLHLPAKLLPQLVMRLKNTPIDCDQYQFCEQLKALSFAARESFDLFRKYTVTQRLYFER
jgi:hypothetical protein